MDDFAGRKIEQLWMPIERKNVALPERHDCSWWLVQLECLKARSTGHIVDGQPSRPKARSCVILNARLFRFGRSSHRNAVIVEPTGRTLLGQTRIERCGQTMAVIKVMRICEGLRNIEAQHET